MRGMICDILSKCGVRSCIRKGCSCIRNVINVINGCVIIAVSWKGGFSNIVNSVEP
jgi:hypothetical protein